MVPDRSKTFKNSRSVNLIQNSDLVFSRGVNLHFLGLNVETKLIQGVHLVPVLNTNLVRVLNFQTMKNH